MQNILTSVLIMPRITPRAIANEPDIISKILSKSFLSSLIAQECLIRKLPCLLIYYVLDILSNIPTTKSGEN